jgi:hypothetical protein
MHTLSAIIKRQRMHALSAIISRIGMPIPKPERVHGARLALPELTLL